VKFSTLKPKPFSKKPRFFTALELGTRLAFNFSTAGPRHPQKSLLVRHQENFLIRRSHAFLCTLYELCRTYTLLA